MKKTIVLAGSHASKDGILSPFEACQIVRQMNVGDSLAYYVGNLATDRSDDGTAAAARAEAVDVLAQYILRQATGEEFSFGECNVVRGMATGHLTQRRLSECQYEYIFTKTSGET